MSFPDLDPELQQAVSDLGFTEMTPIQAAAIPPLLAGRVSPGGEAPLTAGEYGRFAVELHARGRKPADHRTTERPARTEEGMARRCALGGEYPSGDRRLAQ